MLTRAQEKAVEEKLRGVWCDDQMSFEGLEVSAESLEEPTTDVLGVSWETRCV